MAIAYTVGDKSETGAAGTSITVDYPASVAVGELLLIHASKRGGAINTPAGWTEIRKGNAATNIYAVACWKLAVAGDVGPASVALDFTGDNGLDRNARMYRITGAAASPINTSQIGTATSATVTVGTVTPTVANCLFLFLVSADALGAARTCSGYTMATDAPTYTEAYDEQFAGGTDNGQMSAAGGLRTAVTATGNNTATLNASDDNVGIIVAIEPLVVNVTVTPTVVTATATVITPTISASANVTTTVVTATATVQSTTVATGASKWINPDKSSPGSVTNPDKT